LVTYEHSDVIDLNEITQIKLVKWEKKVKQSEQNNQEKNMYLFNHNILYSITKLFDIQTILFALQSNLR
jgi:hypothetical protein